MVGTLEIDVDGALAMAEAAVQHHWLWTADGMNDAAEYLGWSVPGEGKWQWTVTDAGIRIPEVPGRLIRQAGAVFSVDDDKTVRSVVVYVAEIAEQVQYRDCLAPAFDDLCVRLMNAWG
ncbi:DUF6301 family protein [Nocardia sp. NPDC050710]|uniref:DUF6301 family protein n=1 Tax=Nocardia sp. NPDC050710 TaxID=3157220 RepID=UPI003408B4C8